MKSKFIGSLLLAFIATLSIYSLSKIDIYDKININLMKFFRHLSEEKIKENIDLYCSKASGDLVIKYSKTAPDYKYSVPEGNQIAKDFVKSNFTLEGANTLKDNLLKYSTKNKGYFFLFILFCLSVIFWIPCCCCVCCRCCCCVPDILGKFTRIFVYICLAFIVIVLILSIKGLNGNTGIFEGIYGIGCSLLKIEDHLVRGDEYKQQKPYWIGVNGLTEKFTLILNEIDTMRKNAQDLSVRLDSIDPEKLTKELEEEYEFRKTMVVPNPIPEVAEDYFQPVYLNKYGPVNDESSTLGFVNKEYSEIVKTSKNTVKTVLDVINLSDEQYNSFTSGIQDINNFLNETLDDVEDSLGNFLDIFDEYLIIGDSYFRSAMNTLFSLNLVLSIAVAVALVFIFFFDKGRCLLGLAWFFIFFFMLFSLLFGVIFGLLGNLFCDAAYGLDYFLKNIGNLNVLDFSDDFKGTINVCFNGDGALENTDLVPIDSMENPQMLEDIVAIQDNLTEGTSILNSYELLSTNTTITTLFGYKNNLTSISPNLLLAFEQIQKYIDSSVTESKVTNANLYDVWVDNQENCPVGYDYLPPNTKLLRNLLEEKKNCLVILEWEKNDIQTRYNGIKTDTDEEDINNNVLKYYDSITNHIDENNAMIEGIISTMEKSNQAFSDTINEEIKIVSGIFDAIEPIINTVKESLVGDNSIFSLLSCGFLKRDIGFFSSQLYNGLGASLKSISNTFVIIGLFEFFLTLIVLIIMATSAKENKIRSTDIESLGKIID